jgi:uncharacterized membrane protein
MGCYYHPKLPTALRCTDCGHEICASCSDAGVCPGCRLGRAMHAAPARQLPTKTVEAPRGAWTAPPAGQAAAPTTRADVAPVAAAADVSAEDRVLAALCYPLWPLALLMLLLPSAHAKFVRFHVLQSLGVNVLAVALYAVYALAANLPVIGWQSAFALPFLVPAWMLANLYLAIRAATGQSPRVPFAADFANKFG